jgi:hypothetical protein
MLKNFEKVEQMGDRHKLGQNGCSKGKRMTGLNWLRVR